MTNFYDSYVRAFVKYAERLIHKFAEVRQITWYASLLHNKANELIKRAMRNAVDIVARLETKLHNLGKAYVSKYSKKTRKYVDQLVTRPSLVLPRPVPGAGENV